MRGKLENVFISNVSRLLRQLFVTEKVQTTAELSQVIVKVISKHPGGRPPVKIDVAEAYRLRGMGWSDMRIGRHFKVSPTTVATRLRAYKPEPPLSKAVSDQAPANAAHVTTFVE
jgi:hypothetical protein